MHAAMAVSSGRALAFAARPWIGPPKELLQVNTSLLQAFGTVRRASEVDTSGQARSGRHRGFLRSVGSAASSSGGHSNSGDATLGVVGAVVASVGAVCNGSFSVPLKLARKRYPRLSDPVFQMFWAVGVGLASLATIPLSGMIFGGTGFQFSAMGIVSGFFSALATVCVLIAVQRLGVGLPPSLYAASFIITGVVEDLVVLGHSVASPALLILALCLMCVAAAGIAFSKVLSDREAKRSSPATRWQSLPESDEHARVSRSSFTLGLVAAFMVGVFGSFVPLTSKMAGQGPFDYVASFGIGLLLVHIPLVPALMLVAYGRSWPSSQEAALAETAPYGLVSGVLWGLGNAGLNFALTAGTRFDIAISIYQCGLFVSGLWGILVFGEISGCGPIALFCGSAVLLFGSIALEGQALP